MKNKKEYIVGVPVLCKRDLFTNHQIPYSPDNNKYHFLKGNYYNVVDHLYVDSDWQFILKSELSSVCRIREKSMYSWFYTKKELRKLKLQNIINNDR